MSNIINIMDGFARDENGKIHIRPMKLPDCMLPTSSTKKSGGKTSINRRKFIPLEPLKFDPSDFEEFENPSKKPKLERPVRKELFKVPHKNRENRFSSYNGRRSMVKNIMQTQTKSTTTKKKNIPKKQQVLYNDGSPLFDIDEAEQLAIQSKTMLKPTKTVLFPCIRLIEEETNKSILTTELENTSSRENIKIKNSDIPINNLEHNIRRTSSSENFSNNPSKNTPVKTSQDKNVVTPTSTESMQSELEFLHLEKIFASAKKNHKIADPSSPMTSVCNLLENTKIQTPGDEKHINQNPILGEILALVAEDREQLHSFKKEFETQITSIQEKYNCYLKYHQSRLDRIINLVKVNDGNKESNTSNRRSLRIAIQSTKTIVSPTISKKVDLRKTTLNKNLTKNLQHESPRMKKAVEMYNNIRSDCSILSTPKLDRGNIDTSASVTRSLSRRIQKQCLLLQDTPRPS